jgi:hypothetical protein
LWIHLVLALYLLTSPLSPSFSDLWSSLSRLAVATGFPGSLCEQEEEKKCDVERELLD